MCMGVQSVLMAHLRYDTLENTHHFFHEVYQLRELLFNRHVAAR